MLEEVIRCSFIYVHLIFFALAFYTLLACDYAMLVRRWSVDSLLVVTKQMKLFLLGLWVTGVIVIVLDVGTDLSLLFGNNKLLFKLIVVTLLTINGMLIHNIGMPIMESPHKTTLQDARKLTFLSSMSTSHWFLAAFVGCFKPIKSMEWGQILPLYFCLLAFVMLIAFLVSPHTLEVINHRKAKTFLRRKGIGNSADDNIELIAIR